MIRLLLILGITFASAKCLGQSVIYFEKNSDKINSYSKLKLDSLCIAISQSNPLEEIGLRGHTDEDAGELFNKSLSLKRAKAVRDYFVVKGLTNRIHIDSKGETELLNTSNNESDKAKNRRVEIIRNCSENNLVFDKFEKDFQIYTINPKRDTVLQCEFGAKIKIDKSTIATSDDLSTVTIKVQEFYSKKDFVLSNLTTQDLNNALLESGGMIKVEAYQGNKQLIVKPNNNISVLFKDKTLNDKMEMFNGIDHNNQVTWSNSTNATTSKTVSGMSYTTIYGERIKEEKWKYELINGQNMKITETKERGKVRYDTVSAESDKVVEDLWLNTNKFGWINCDRFYKYESPKVDIIVQYSGAFVPSVVAVFKDINSIMPYTYREDNKLIFKNIPSDLEINFIGIHGSKDKEKILFAQKRTKTKSGAIENIVFEGLLPKEIEQKMKAL